jgi:diadenylate cyclase
LVKDDKIKEEGIMESIRRLAPGTPLREGLENILRAKTGALIVIGDNKDVMNLVDGGFNINMDLTPAYMYELAKMDGAIILSSDAKKILYANTQLIPDPSIPSSETGIRHRTAERVARQTGLIVISISQRRNIITIYKGYSKYIVQDTNKILNKANQAIQTLEKYKKVLDQAMTNLTALEFEDLVTIYDVAVVIQRTEMVMKIVGEIDKYIRELGNEGRLVNMQLEELLVNVKEDGEQIIKDYIHDSRIDDILHASREIKYLSSDELLDLTNICKILGYYGGIDVLLDTPVHPRGYRMLSKIQRLPMAIIHKVVIHFGNFQKILKATTDELDDVEGIGEIRARTIKEGLRRVQEIAALDRHIR